jgi:penicillin-binding protein 1A
LFKFFFVLGLWCAIALILFLAWFARDLPDITRKATFDRRTAITVLANDGSVVARYGDHKGKNLTIDEIPSDLVNALLAIEDRRFYYHFGIDPIGIARAMVINVQKGGYVQGGSTLTQQLAKNLFLTQERALTRKIKEAMLAVWLEYELSKDEIISAYLNRVYLGSGAYGIEAASRIYFDKHATDLTLRESALIAGLLKAPSKYSPRSNPAAALARADVVLNAMKKHGFLEGDIIPPSSHVKPTKKPIGGNTNRYYSDWVIEQLDDIIGTPDSDLVIETTMDPQIQETTARVIAETVQSKGEGSGFTQGASIVMRPDGSVLAIVGGVNYGRSQFNRATAALRPPGSSFKPLVYLTALNNGWEADSTIEDAPIEKGKYRPRNFGHKYHGEVTLFEALTWSLNTVAVNLAKDVGIDKVVSTARLLGIKTDLEPDLSLALGSSGVPMIEMVGAYATIANGGVSVDPYGIKSIKNDNGDVLYEHSSKGRHTQVISGYSIAALTEMMNSVVVNGTGQAANPGFFAAGKTGTSQDYRDGWFTGFSNYYISSVWYGNDDNSSTKRLTGGSFPAQSWRKIIQSAHSDPSPSRYRHIKGEEPGFDGFLLRLFGQDDDEWNDAPDRKKQGWFKNSPRNADKDVTGSQRFND